LSEDGLDDDMARVGLVAPTFQFWDRPSKSPSRNSITLFSSMTRGIRSSCNASNSKP